MLCFSQFVNLTLLLNFLVNIWLQLCLVSCLCFFNGILSLLLLLLDDLKLLEEIYFFRRSLAVVFIYLGIIFSLTDLVSCLLNLHLFVLFFERVLNPLNRALKVCQV